VEGSEDLNDSLEPMPCYEENPTLGATVDDGQCAHCRKFLTTECEYIDHFLEEDGE
jgi:hypothetical protein